MYVKDDLLKDAIAEAKAVRETALANAKLAITEAFAPKIQSMLSTAIQNENDEEFSADELELPGDGMEMEDPLADPMADPMGGMEETNGAPVSNEPMSAAPAAPSMGAPVSEDEFSLDNIIRELEQDAAAADSANDQFVTNEQEGDEDTVEEQSETTGFAKADNKKPSPKSSSSSATEDPQGSIKPNHPKAQTGETYLKEEKDEDINLEELIRELKQEYSDVTEEENSTEKELEELTSALNEHREVIKFLRSRLNEINLLNSKLLFTNLLLKNHNLNESQKYKVVETLDRATTIKESKLVYSTLEEAFTSTGNSKNSSAKRIVENIASHNVGSTKPSKETQKTILNEGTELARRFQKLAGIKIK